MRRHDPGLRSNRRDFPSQDVYDELGRLVSLAKEEISQLLPLEEQLEKLIALFYGDWGFKASRGVYRLSDALWLDQVLKNRQGSAVSLGAVLLWVANRLDLPLLPVIFPTQLILRIECPDGEIWLINPFNGESLSEHMLDVWLKGNISPSAELFYEDLDEADNIEVNPQIAGYTQSLVDGRKSDGAGVTHQRSFTTIQP